MDKLNQLLVGKPLLEFGAAFGAVTWDSGLEATQPQASFWLEGGVTPAGAGFVWGHGEIHYEGCNHAFRLSALVIQNVVSAGISAAGRVLYLRNLSDFSGNYLDSRAGSIGGDRGSVQYLKNERGVMIKLIATDGAQRINWPINGMRVRLKRQKPLSAGTD
ncbi:MAG TPA: hypothetical protein VMA54_21820 [Steroidobacteraceae bacterium]|nr:hypothetical protein [Steroidobacteraceae bacterium]